jgi:hypothetical protein
MVALLAWSASQFFLFLPAQHLPLSAAGSGKRQASYQPRSGCFAGKWVREQRRGKESTSPNGDVLSLAPQVGLEPTTHTVRNMVALLAWSASQFSLFLSTQRLASSSAGRAGLRVS